jgi:putative tricarboxylic transport membrane protein
MLIVLQYHGVPLGPKLFMDQPQMAAGVIMAMVVSYIFMLFTVIPLARYLSRVILISTRVLAPVIIAFTLVGAFAPRQYLFDLGLALAFGVLGYIARKTNYHVAAILIGVILGPLVEQSYLRALRIAEGNPMVLFSSHLGNVLWSFLAISIALPYLNSFWRRYRARETRHG